ncbi:MAG: 4Fe-4S binding protein [Caldilinea sp.]|jgi:2-oxoglutarate ferredoxin oxidoreductase subunit delta|nr:4Fe-4S binding protein [Caldilinea sp.]
MAQGTLLIQTDRCKGCGLCIRACPQQVLVAGQHFNALGYQPVQLDEEVRRCTGCGVCAWVCPDLVFTVYRESAGRAG